MVENSRTSNVWQTNIANISEINFDKTKYYIIRNQMSVTFWRKILHVSIYYIYPTLELQHSTYIKHCIEQFMVNYYGMVIFF